MKQKNINLSMLHKYQCPTDSKCGGCAEDCKWKDNKNILKYRVKSIPEFLEVVMYYRYRGYYSFRGQRDNKWSLGVGFRFLDMKPGWNAIKYLEHFKKRSLSLPQHVHLPEGDEWRWLFLAQHHGLKTKLLDWSSNPLVALYFAVENIISKSSDNVGGAIWALKVSDDYFLDPNNAGNPDFTLKEVKSKMILDKPKTDWYMVNPPPFSPRIERQSGKFSYHPDFNQNVSDYEKNNGRNRELILICLRDNRIQMTEVNAGIRRQLGIMNIHHSSMFPEHSGIADFINHELEQLSPTDE
jgi:hypothetical protein